MPSSYWACYRIKQLENFTKYDPSTEEEGHTLTTPDHLRVGDTVNVQLWLEGEEAFIDIRLGIVTRVHKHWIGVDVIQVRSKDRIRLKRFLDTSIAMHIEEPALIDHLLIRV